MHYIIINNIINKGLTIIDIHIGEAMHQETYVARWTPYAMQYLQCHQTDSTGAS